jgi:hypothetical protein
MADRRAKFEKVRRAVTTARPMIDGVDAEGFLSDLELYLRVEGLDELDFRKLPEARLRFDGTARLSDVPARVGRRLVREWLDELVMDGGEDHISEVTDDGLVFEFVTWSDRLGCASGRLTARRRR